MLGDDDHNHNMECGAEFVVDVQLESQVCTSICMIGCCVLPSVFVVFYQLYLEKLLRDIASTLCKIMKPMVLVTTNLHLHQRCRCAIVFQVHACEGTILDVWQCLTICLFWIDFMLDFSSTKCLILLWNYTHLLLVQKLYILYLPILTVEEQYLLLPRHNSWIR